MKRTETREVEVTYCDRCGRSGGTMITTDDPMAVLPREIDLCLSCTRVVFPDMFAPKPHRQKRSKGLVS